MNIILIAAVGLGMLSFQNGKAVMDGPKRIVAIQASSRAANATIKMESVQSYVTYADVSHPETNIVNVVSNIPYSVTNVVDVITNVVGGVTNYIDVVTNVVGGVTNIINMFTNVIDSARRVEYSLTNVTTITEKRTDVHWMTNVLVDVILNAGRYSSVTNIFVPYSPVYLSGTAVTNGVLNVFVE